jgi:hypothetical protein
MDEALSGASNLYMMMCSFMDVVRLMKRLKGITMWNSEL